jgi:hypothetical protein
MQNELRRHERKESSGMFRVYTNLTCCAYTVQLRDVSKNGAFIRNKHLPQVGDVITYMVLDNVATVHQAGNAKVVRVQAQGTEDEVGFAIEMEQALTDEALQLLC